MNPPEELNNGTIQEAQNDNPEESDEGVASSIKNGNRKNPPQIADNVVKMVVIGEPRCGKTIFIRNYYDHHSPGGIYSHNGVRVYPCELQGFDRQRRASIFEIPGDPEFHPEQRTPHYEDADVIVFMYAIDDPTSLQMLADKWIEESIDIINFYNLPVVLVANKIDLRNDEQVIDHLALQNESPITFEQGSELLDRFSGHRTILECSAIDLEIVEVAFEIIMGYVLLGD